MTADTITFAELLTRLGYGTHDGAKHENVSVCHQPVGGSFNSDVTGWENAPGLVGNILERYEWNLWFGVNALGVVAKGRGKVNDVTRLCALYADLDFKDGACADMDAALDIIDDVSGVLGERPVAITHSGHGVQPFWAIDVESALTLNNGEAKALLERFGRLMKAVAAHHGCAVDGVFDLPRVLRVPDTTNWKSDPVPVRCSPDVGKPLTVEQIYTALDTYGITEERPRRVRASGNGQGPAPDEYYSRACLINRVAKSPSGRRNTTLYGATLDAAKQGDLDDEMIEALENAAEECGLSWEDGTQSVSETMNSAIRKAESQGYEIDGNPYTATRTQERARTRGSATQNEPSLLDRLARDGAWLDDQQFAPMEYAVEGIVPEGMGLLVGPPKKGKSWLVADIGLAVARGGLALGAIWTTQRPVLYLALEDGDRRLQSRFRRLLGFGQPIPPGIRRITEASPGEAMAVIAEFMHRYADEKPLVILDTLGKVKRHKKPSEDSYLVDYEVGSTLKKLADAVPGSTLLVVHHTRKAEAADFVDTVSGTQGIAGSVDFVLVLTRKRHENNAILSVTGRDISEAEYALYADDGVLWRLDGADLDTARENVQQRRAEASMGDRQMDVYLIVVAAANDPVTAIEVAGQLEGMDNDAAGQYLRRLHASGHIHKISRGVFSLRPPAEATEEEVEAAPTDSFTSDSGSEAVSESTTPADQGEHTDSDTSINSFTLSESTTAQNTVKEVSEVNESACRARSKGVGDSDSYSDSVTEVKEQEDTLHLRIKGVITRRLQRVKQERRYRLRMAVDSRDRAEFDAVFGSLVEQQHLVTVEGDETLWRLANP